MLKIVRRVQSGRVSFVVSGRIDIEHALELQSMIDREPTAIVLNLAEVRRVDRDALPFVARWATSGITLENCSAYIRAWIANASTSRTPR
jgi:hypothetical protein